jgi:hypothetical protein
MAGIELSDLGLTQEDMANRVIEAIADRFLDDDDYCGLIDAKVNKAIVEQIDAAVEKLGVETIAPRITELVEGHCLQETNKWGEATGQKLTFTEYLIDRAERFLTEEVDHDGTTKAESRDSYNWRPYAGRVATMIDNHLQYSIATAMKKALESANSQIADGIAKTVKLQLAEILKKFSVEVRV